MLNIARCLTYKLRHWVKHRKHPLAKYAYTFFKRCQGFEIPAPRLIYTPLRLLYHGLKNLITTLLRIVWWTPLFKTQLSQVGKRLYLYGGLPYLSGPLTLTVGDDCRISAHSTFSGRTAGTSTPQLRIGSNVDIGWMTTIAVGRQISIGHHVRIAGRAFLAGYPGHPISAKDRAAGLPDMENQVGDIVLEDNVWLATGVSVMAGVRIGCGTIVAAGSVVCNDLPAGVMAAGIPARVVRILAKEAADEA